MNRDLGSRLAAIDVNVNRRFLSYTVNQTIHSIDVEPMGTDLSEKNMIAAYFLFFFLIVAGLVCAYNKARISHSNNRINEAIYEDSKIAQMSTEGRMVLYCQAFDKNKRQIVLDSSSIIVSERNSADADADTKNTDEEESHDDCELNHNDDDPSVYLALKDARSQRCSTHLRSSINACIDMTSSGSSSGMTNNKGSSVFPKKQQKRKSSLIHPRYSTSTLMDIESGLTVASKTELTSSSNDDIVSGNCVICFEDMQAGEMVVWSETKSCPHVYHKDCMVAYLVHKIQYTKEIELDDNPCPTCRQNFVTVCIPAE